MNEKLKVGIDFGTSNSSVGATVSGELEIFDVYNGRKSQPSSIFVRVDGYHSTGYKAVNDFVGQSTKIDTYHFVPSVKPGLPLEHYEGIVLKSTQRDFDGRFPVRYFTVQEMASYIISDLKQKAEEWTGKETKEAVIGRPVVFSEDLHIDLLAQRRLEEAAEMAGFKSICFMIEPVAAALYYEKFRKKNVNTENVFVFDFGGGTLDTCILELCANKKINMANFESHILSSHGIDLGGTDLDKDVFRYKYLEYFGRDVLWGEKRLPMPYYIFDQIVEWHLIEQLSKNDMFNFLRQILANSTDSEAIKRLITLIQDQQVFAILRSIEKGKIEVSQSKNGKIRHKYKNININDLIFREEFERTIMNRRYEIKECIEECLKKAHMKPDQVDTVLKVGGSSNNAFIDGILDKIFVGKIEDKDVFTGVVAGLSIVAAEIFE